MNKLKVGMVVDPWDLPFNGTVVSARRFVAALSDQVDFRILMTASTGDDTPDGAVLFEKVSIPFVNRIIDRMQAPVAKPNSARLDELMRSIDVLHVQYPFFLAFAAIRAARRAGVPVISSYHVQPENILQNLGLGGPALVPTLYRLFVWAFYNAADHVIAPSHFAADLLRRHGTKTPITVISNGITDQFFDSQPRQPRPAEAPFRLLNVGRLAPEKQQHLIIEAVAQSRHRDRCELRIVGSGPRKDRLQRLAKARGVKANIGPCSDDELLALYRQSDVFIQASTVELEGMSALEAMAMGCPVLLHRSSTSALRELPVQAHAFFEGPSSGALTERLNQVLSNDVHRAEMGKHNLMAARGRSHAECAAQLLALYREISAQDRQLTQLAAG
ncbi:MAG: glycosyltransferase [Pseudomonadales bacterium]